ncbi:MAG: hypothetical protein HUU47_04700 [Bacteroidetes bacterium]|nr:hypothetical protein [Bacteroidota bacterium]
MNTKLKILLLLFSVNMIVSCTNTSKKSNINTSDSLSEIDEHQHNTENDSISLNEGKKWKVNTDMMLHISKMKSDVAIFEKNKKRDYNTLAKNLSKGLDSLTSNCTMEGKAHDELHKWLVPFIELVDEFSENTESKEAEHLYLKIKSSFEEFDKFFE